MFKKSLFCKEGQELHHNLDGYKKHEIIFQLANLQLP